LNKNRLFVVNKPADIGCNLFLSKIKKKYNVKKAGFSGTLDPLASGVIIIANRQNTKLFRFLKKSPKKYRATLHFGVNSKSLDTENIQSIENVDEVDLSKIEKISKELITTITYSPPKFSAKKIDGQRAYDLARKDVEFETKKIETTIYEFKILEYKHPHLTFEISVSEGGYIRSIAAILAEKLGTFGSLSSLERLSEGDFNCAMYQNEESLNPINFLNLEENFYLKDYEDISLGRVLKKEDFKSQDDGEYFLVKEGFLSIIKICNDEVFYELNRVELC
jgi:tRNA pseudouridine55 synthase